MSAAPLDISESLRKEAELLAATQGFDAVVIVATGRKVEVEGDVLATWGAYGYTGNFHAAAGCLEYASEAMKEMRSGE